MSVSMRSLHINIKLPRIQINQYRCFAEEGLKNNGDLTRELTGLSEKEFSKSLARTVQEGDRMGRIGRNSLRTLLVQFARERARPDVATNVDCIPKSRPKITVEKGYVKLEWAESGSIIDQSV